MKSMLLIRGPLKSNKYCVQKMDYKRKLFFFIILVKEFLYKKTSTTKINLKYLQMLHCGKFYIDFHDINMHNFTLATAGVIGVECEW